MKSCDCRQFKMSTAYKIPTPVELKNISAPEMWACGDCHNHRFAVQEPVPVIRAPKNAAALVHAKHDSDGQRTLTWRLKDGSTVDTVSYFPWSRRFPNTELDSIIYLQWEHLMGKVRIIVGGEGRDGLNDDEVRELLQRSRYEARGIAEVLAIQMKGFIESADEVVKHAVAWFKDPDYEIPGLAPHLWDPLRDASGKYYHFDEQMKGKKPAPAPAPAIPADSVKGIREALASGMFSAADIAGMYKVPVEAVEELAKGS